MARAFISRFSTAARKTLRSTSRTPRRAPSVSALFQRERSGRGAHIDLAMFDSLLAMQVTALSRLLAEGRAPARVGNRHPVTVPVDSFQAKDGLFAMVVPSNPHFGRLCTLIGRPAL